MSKEPLHNYEVIIDGIGFRQFIADRVVEGIDGIYFKIDKQIVAQFNSDIFLGYIDYGPNITHVTVDSQRCSNE